MADTTAGWEALTKERIEAIKDLKQRTFAIEYLALNKGWEWIATAPAADVVSEAKTAAGW